jgi:hypothetical protein
MVKVTYMDGVEDRIPTSDFNLSEGNEFIYMKCPTETVFIPFQVIKKIVVEGPKSAKKLPGKKTSKSNISLGFHLEEKQEISDPVK